MQPLHESPLPAAGPRQALALTLALAFSWLAPSGVASATAQQATGAQPAEAIPLGHAEQAVAVSAGTLDTYVGTYQISPGFEVRIRREGDGLALQATGQAAWLLQAISETQFKVRGQQASVTFVHDASGEVGLLVLDMDGRQTRATRR